jgi:hypothetical protein
LPETIQPSGRQEAPLDTDAPKTIKKEERIPSSTIRWKKKIVDEPEEFVDDAELEP